MTNAMSADERISLFWARVAKEPDSDCWTWKGKVTRDGYGAVKIFGVVRGAHRVAYEIEYQDAADGLCVMHSCDNPLCCNPAHLFKGTHTDNMQDMIRKGRQKSGGKKRTILNFESAEKIRLDFAGGKSKHAISREYGVCPLHVRHIIAGRYWKKPLPQKG